MLVHRRVTPSIKFAGTHSYTWVERGTVRVKCLTQEHNTMSPARALARTARSGDERTNHEATAPLMYGPCGWWDIKYIYPGSNKNAYTWTTINFGQNIVILFYMVPLPPFP